MEIAWTSSRGGCLEGHGGRCLIFVNPPPPVWHPSVIDMFSQITRCARSAPAPARRGAGRALLRVRELPRAARAPRRGPFRVPAGPRLLAVPRCYSCPGARKSRGSRRGGQGRGEAGSEAGAGRARAVLVGLASLVAIFSISPTFSAMSYMLAVAAVLMSTSNGFILTQRWLRPQ